MYSLFLSVNDINRTKAERPLVLSMTASVDVPENMEFAGEKISFDRYDRRERMDRELNSFTYFHSTTLLLFKRANRIFPVIEPILKKEGIPDDLKYLAVIESSLDYRAVSPARAAGLWQFIQSTGKQYGLEVTSDVDERYHVENLLLPPAATLRMHIANMVHGAVRRYLITADRHALQASWTNRGGWTTRSTFGWWRRLRDTTTECWLSSLFLKIPPRNMDL